MDACYYISPCPNTHTTSSSMFFLLRFLRWIRKRFEESQLLEEIKASKGQRQSRSETLDERQTRALQLKLEELKFTMDPLMATQVYNRRFCPFGRLPEELLLLIIGFLDDDVVTLHCLRNVSMTFFRILNFRSGIWKQEWYDIDMKRKPDSTDSRTFFLKRVPKQQFRHLIRRDGRCDSCRRWNDAHILSGAIEGHARIRHKLRKIYCDGCGNHHNACQFSTIHQQSETYQGERQCLGQQGSVRLCEHVQITWASIKAHIDHWRQQQRKGGEAGGGAHGWQVFLNTFKIECKEAIHDVRCTASEDPTWPRARLRRCNGSWLPMAVVLKLEWTCHVRIDSLPLTADGRIPASALRAQFEKIRQSGPAETIYTPIRPDALPEMAFFKPSSFTERHVYYGSGEDKEIPPVLLPPTRTLTTVKQKPPPEFRPLPSDRKTDWWFQCLLNMTRRSGDVVVMDQELDVSPHWISGSRETCISHQCLELHYEKNIPICERTAMTNPAINIDPSDQWLHAMEAGTYPRPLGPFIRPEWRNEGCQNYFARPRRNFYSCSGCSGHSWI